MTAKEERSFIIRSYPIYRLFNVLAGTVIAAGLLLAAGLSNSAADLLVGTGLSAFLGARVNEKTTLGVLVLTAGICALIVFMQSLYFAAKSKETIPVV